DGYADVITGAGPGGGPHVQVFSGKDNAVLASFMAYDPGFRNGITVGAGDLDGDFKAEVMTGAGPGGGPHVQAFDLAHHKTVLSFYAYDPGFHGGVLVAAGDT